jgi:hypothetical protein
MVFACGGVVDRRPRTWQTGHRSVTDMPCRGAGGARRQYHRIAAPFIAQRGGGPQGRCDAEAALATGCVAYPLKPFPGRTPIDAVAAAVAE